MTNQTLNLSYTLTDIRPGQHIGWFYTDAETYRRGLTTFIRDGLSQNHKVWSIFEAASFEMRIAEVKARLDAEGIDSTAAIQRGAWRITTAEETYLSGNGTFTPQAMLTALRDAITAALDEGYAALRVTGDMRWSLHAVAGAELLEDYESQLNALISQSPCIALCQYNLNHFTPASLQGILMAHPLLLVDQQILSNIYYISEQDQHIHTSPFEGWMQNLIRHNRLQAQLAASEARYRRIVETANVGIWQMDAEYRTIMVNPFMTAMLGYTEAEMLGRTVTEFMHPDDLVDHTQRMEQRRLGFHDRYKRRFLRKDGSICYTEVSATALQDSEGRFSGSFAMVVDITALHRSIEELTLLNQAGQALNSSLDLDEVLLNILRETRRLLNITATSIWLREAETGDLVCRQSIGPQNENLHGWRVPAGQGIAGYIATTAQSQLVADVWSDPRHYHSITTGTHVPVHALLGVPLIGKHGVLGVIEAIDIHPHRFTDADQKLLESLAATAALAIENANLYAQAQRETQLKSQLLREINHRISNTLNILQSMFELEIHHALPEDRAAYERLGTTMWQRVQGFAEIHKLLATLNQWGPLPVAALVQMLTTAITGSWPDTQVAIETHGDTTMLTPQQASYLAMILNELLTNTLKYARPQQGPLCIKITIAEEPPTDLVIEVNDNGQGYPADVLEGKRSHVGIHLARVFTEQQLEGTLTLNNTPGATARLRFPKKPLPDDQRDSSPPSSSAQWRSNVEHSNGFL